MKPSSQFTIELSDDCQTQLRDLAATVQRSVDDLAEEALTAYLDLQSCQRAAIEQSLDDVQRGVIPVDHAAVAEWVESWGRKDELPPPR